MSKIVLNPTSTAQWHALVGEAQQAASCHLDEQMESYLVFLLMRFADQPRLFSSVIALDFLDSQQHTGQGRRMRLRDVGDHCLLFSGLFPKIAERRLVRLSYFIDVGRSAYLQISDMQTDVAEDHQHLFTRLACEFIQLMEVLQSMRPANDADHPLSPLQAFDLWSDTGSRLALQHHSAAMPLDDQSANDPVSRPDSSIIH